jgi:hypothetical protein
VPPHPPPLFLITKYMSSQKKGSNDAVLIQVCSEFIRIELQLF